jgi:hypothetical protein
MNARIVMIDEFNIASHADGRSRRNIIRRNVSALDFLSKEFDSSGVRRHRELAYQCKELVTVRRCQNDRRSLLRLPIIFIGRISVSCVHI